MALSADTTAAAAELIGRGGAALSRELTATASREAEVARRLALRAQGQAAAARDELRAARAGTADAKKRLVSLTRRADALAVELRAANARERAERERARRLEVRRLGVWDSRVRRRATGDGMPHCASVRLKH